MAAPDRFLHSPQGAVIGGIIVLSLLAALGHAAAQTSPSHQHGAGPASVTLSCDGPELWELDPKYMGCNRPPVGRSLFDFLVFKGSGILKPCGVPFPFEALLKCIATRLEGSGSHAIVRALIPLTRSLSRRDASPDYFSSPRVVIAVTGDPPLSQTDAGWFLKDRLYLGYQAKANAIEVISYNESAGRFEFQVVDNYKTDGTPRIRYANRALCRACHQNQAPIFPRPPWSDFNHASIVDVLRSALGNRNVQDPGQVKLFDDSTDRANAFSVSQLVWRKGCAELNQPNTESTHTPNPSTTELMDTPRANTCRADLFRFALQYRLSGRRDFAYFSARLTSDSLPLRQRWEREWREHLMIPDPDIEDRNPFMQLAEILKPLQEGAQQAGREANALQKALGKPTIDHIWQQLGANLDRRGRYDPTLKRSLRNNWPSTGDKAARMELTDLIKNLSELIAEPDVLRLDRFLHARARGTDLEQQHYMPCEFERLDESWRAMTFTCPPYRGPNGPGIADGPTVQGEIALDPNPGSTVRGHLRTLVFENAESLNDLRLSGTVTREAGFTNAQLRAAYPISTLHVRRSDGSALGPFMLRWEPPGSPQSTVTRGQATLTVVHDFDLVDKALRSMLEDGRGAKDIHLFSGLVPFRRASLMKALYDRLGVAPLDWCCLDDGGMPPPELGANLPERWESKLKEKTPRPNDVYLNKFDSHCQVCHGSSDHKFPPNFMLGTDEQVKQNMRQCAPRILFRLSMEDERWRNDPDGPPEAPMPPLVALELHWDLHPGHKGAQHNEDHKMMKQYVASMIIDTGVSPKPDPGKMDVSVMDELIDGYVKTTGYDNLPPCLNP